MTEPRLHWDNRYKSSSGGAEAALFLDETADLLPAGGSMVDVAGGLGANAMWFARRGFAATVVDISGEALKRVHQAASTEGLDVACINRDVEADAMPSDLSWDVALMHLFWNREVLLALPRALNPGGVLLFAQPTVLNLERHERPGRRFLLALGELAELANEMVDLDVVELSEGWRSSTRHEARLVARRA